MIPEDIHIIAKLKGDKRIEELNKLNTQDQFYNTGIMTSVEQIEEDFDVEITYTKGDSETFKRNGQAVKLHIKRIVKDLTKDYK